MSTTSRSDRGSGFKLDRLAGFSDGVIAIAITLLVLGLEVPSSHTVNTSELGNYLRESLHPAMGYVVSFVLIGTFWLSHYVIFHYLTHATRPLIVLNGLFLLCLTFLPFPTGLQAAYRHDEFAMVFYSFSLFMCGVTLLGIWLYASKQHRLINPNTSPTVVQSMTQRLAIAPSLCILAIGCSFLSIGISRMILLAIPCFYFSHQLVDSGWRALAPSS
ncbi:TMEM175 family protein [Novipirellula sp.]|uniref:TMEM175 family protein n=1 Tax=Novipirellula sp. TaxID=2795430 RepID=UPI00356B22E4